MIAIDAQGNVLVTDRWNQTRHIHVIGADGISLTGLLRSLMSYPISVPVMARWLSLGTTSPKTKRRAELEKRKGKYSNGTLIPGMGVRVSESESVCVCVCVYMYEATSHCL